jgi:SAM-dependent methyltransferase
MERLQGADARQLARRQIIGCARRSPSNSSGDAGSTPATSTLTSKGVLRIRPECCCQPEHCWRCLHAPCRRHLSKSADDLALRAVQQHEHGEQHGAASPATEWDARYGERDAMWSGRPNGRLVAEVADSTPGRALDVGCGEGADAIWLARRGWQVTAIDVSDVAVGRAREAADAAGAPVEWICGDALLTPLPAHSFDLVSMQYPALPKSAGDAAVQTLLDTVRPGGLLLAVYHDLDNEHREHMKARGIDPFDYVGVDDIGRLLGDDFTVEMHATEPRMDPPPGTPHVADAVLRARRR